MFSYDVQKQHDCILYDASTTLTSSCSRAEGTLVETFVMYTRGQFTRREGACLTDEKTIESPDDRLLFDGKSVVECAALCDEWFECRSFRVDGSGTCNLFKSEEYSNTACPLLDAPAGELYGYYSDFFYVELSENFCVSASSSIFINGAPLEACKTLCDKIVTCVAFEHNKQGDCILLDSSDFSVSCQPNLDKKLYIGYKDVVTPRPKFAYSGERKTQNPQSQAAALKRKLTSFLF
jgi:hypothetical protein